VTTYDLILRGSTLAMAEEPQEADFAVEDGRIAARALDLEGSGTEEVDARELYVFPGAIGAHAHFNEPGRTHWEGFATGSRALAAGGMTAYVEMPLNAYRPPSARRASTSNSPPWRPPRLWTSRSGADSPPATSGAREGGMANVNDLRVATIDKSRQRR
jgi:hypothetical protein